MTASTILTIPVNTSAFLSDGNLVERIAGDQLASWRGDTLIVAPNIQSGADTYVAAPLDSGLADSLRLPPTVATGVEPGKLLETLELLFTQSGLTSADALVLATAAFATWVGDAAESPVWVHLQGDGGSHMLTLLRSIVYQPLFLSCLQASELAKLPQNLTPTLLVNQPNERALRDIRVLTSPGVGSILRSGRILQMPRCAAFTSGTTHIEAGALPIALPALPFMTARVRREELEQQLRPQLVAFRLAYWQKVRGLAERSTPSAGRGCLTLQSALLAAAPDVLPRLQQALAIIEETTKSTLSQSDHAFVLEALRLFVHEKRADAVMQEVADAVNVLLLGRAQSRSMTAKAVGSLVRELGFHTRRLAAGYALRLDCETAARIHELAAVYGSLSTLYPATDCRWCGHAGHNGNVADDCDAAEEDVHNVHEVHLVHTDCFAPEVVLDGTGYREL